MNVTRLLLSQEDGLKSVATRQEVASLTGSSLLGGIMVACRADAMPTSTCPHCQWTLDDLLQTHLMGCGLCYTALYPAYEKAMAAQSSA